MHDLAHLKDTAGNAHGTLERARASYREAARRYLIAELVALLGERPGVAALHLDAHYEYDDEGGYFLCVNGSFTLAEDATEDELLDECWTEALDVEAPVILDLFGVDRTGEATLARVEIYVLATAEGIAVPRSPGAASLPSTARSREGR